ncbi:MAG: rod shape-determining protein RodA [Rhodanobacter sp.]|jgi:rod shape determining protein RodA|uniref:Peptidoglycan glycosyltransferase MrdB n=2 Tax=unclassified Rhodanobacter TaxID=2621553 RepID=A0AB74UV04_9GAMM|nr:rod shape-determining protein RodA [Rhodanobacter sp.]MBN8948863.1 rod shape-determining protein RodA [Rhodanobacter sp.]OJW45318.1 MAG: rod shape-determining protein RodA [Rhodanobacter sp. 67-28]
MIGVLRARMRRFAHRVMTRRRIDLPLAAGLFVLALIGLATLYSAGDRSLALVGGQAARFVLGGALLLLVSRIPPPVLRSWTPGLYAVSVALLVVVAILGEGRGSMRWLDLGVMRFQPSELLKLTTPMMVAWYLHPRQLPPGWKDIAVVGILIAIPAALIAEQPDLGTAVLVATAGAFALFLSGMAWWRIGLLVGAVVGMIPIGWHFLHQYQRDRVLTLLNPESDPLGNGWHIIQSQIAVGSGGVFGKGWLHSTQSRLDFLPEHTTDFIFAVFSEEFGLVGVCALIALYAFIIGRCLWIAMEARDTYSRLLAGAIGMSFFVYVFVNGGMVAGMLPVVGVPMPMISYGGTSAVSLLTGFGVLMSIHANRKSHI